MVDLLGGVWLFQLFGKLCVEACALLCALVFRVQDGVHCVAAVAGLQSECLPALALVLRRECLISTSLSFFSPRSCPTRSCAAILIYLRHFFNPSTNNILVSQGAQVTYQSVLKPVLANVSNTTVVKQTEASASASGVSSE